MIRTKGKSRQTLNFGIRRECATPAIGIFRWINYLYSIVCAPWTQKNMLLCMYTLWSMPRSKCLVKFTYSCPPCSQNHIFNVEYENKSETKGQKYPFDNGIYGNIEEQHTGCTSVPSYTCTHRPQEVCEERFLWGIEDLLL